MSRSTRTLQGMMSLRVGRGKPDAVPAEKISQPKRLLTHPPRPLLSSVSASGASQPALPRPPTSSRRRTSAPPPTGSGTC
eukprot:1088596-Rhodomonas_salina.1